MTSGIKAGAAAGAAVTALLIPALVVGESTAANAAEPAFVRVLNGYDGPTAITVAFDGRPAAQLAWASATSWTATAAGAQHISVNAAGNPPAQLTASPQAGCNTTVIILRASAADDTPTAATVADCNTTRIPTGQARITAVGSSVNELGPVEAHLGTTTVTLQPRQFPVVEQDVPAGPQTLAVGAPGTGEVYQRIQPDLQSGATYTLLYLGGGETPAHLVLLQDGRQATNPPPPNLPINTGLAGPGGNPPPATKAAILGALLLIAGILRHRLRVQRNAHRPDRARRARQVAATAGLLLCCSCGVALTPSAGGAVTVPPSSGSDQPSPPQHPAASSPATSGPAEEPAGTVPTTLTIPVLQRTDPLIPFSTAEISQLPRSLPLQQVSWLSGSSLIGEPGTTAVIAHTTAPGHTPAPFNDLGNLQAGQQLHVTGSNGSTYNYQVVSIDVTPKGALPQSVFGPRPVSTLVLITCTDGGTGPPGSYLDNLIVTALPSGST